MFQIEITDTTNLEELFICDECDKFFPRSGYVSHPDCVIHLKFDYPIIAKEVWKDYASRFVIRYFHKECLEGSNV
jgi:hypothetical protein